RHFMNSLPDGLYFAVNRPAAVPLADIGRVFPTHFSFVEEDAKLFLVVTGFAEVDLALHEVMRECDRLLFVTGEDLAPAYSHLVRADKTRTVVKTIAGTSRIVKPVPATLGRQH